MGDAAQAPAATANLARYDLLSLRLVVECVAAGNLSLAAPRMHLTVSAASHRLAHLEQALGTALFERRWRALVPTPAGRLVATKARPILALVAELDAALAAPEAATAAARGMATHDCPRPWT